MSGIEGDDLTKLNHMVSKYPDLARTRVIISYAGGYNKEYSNLVDFNIMKQKRVTPENLIADLKKAGYQFDEEETRAKAISDFAFKRPDAYMEMQQAKIADQEKGQGL
jgi:hypothetical protein